MDILIISKAYNKVFIGIHKLVKNINYKFQKIENLENLENMINITNLNDSIHQFLNSILAFGCISCPIESIFQKRPIKYKKSCTKKEIFYKQFQFNQENNNYRYNLLKVQNEVKNNLNIKNNNLPKIFKSNISFNRLISIEFPKEYIENIFELLWKPYSFSLNEQILEKENEKIINPKTLGKILELSLQPNKKDKVQKGVYFTPKSEIEFTVFVSLLQFLTSNEVFNKLTKKNKKKKDNNIKFSNIFNYLFTVFSKSTEKDNLTKEEGKYILNSLKNIKILDPACGSGDFLIVFLKYLLKIYRIQNIKKEKIIKILPMIFGMDISYWASIISEFRLWLFLLVNLENNDKLNNLQDNQIPRNNISITKGDFLLDNKLLKEKSTSFQIIIGNPPYIRNRDICDPAYNSKKNNIKYREKIKKSLKKIKNLDQDFSKRIDYCIYFYLHSLSFLSPGGILGFIVSNSWMNVRYGYKFQEYLCKNIQIKQFYDNQFRSFSRADINTIISILQKPLGKINMDLEEGIKFIKLKIPYRSLLKNNKMEKSLFQLIKGDNKNNNQKFDAIENSLGRCVKNTQRAIFLFNSLNKLDKQKNIKYRGYNWANYFFNAPLFYFKLREKIGTNIVLLKDIAEIRRGITTNCNNFFIMEKIGKKLFRNGYGDEIETNSKYIVPIISSPKQIITPKINLENISTYIFYTNKSKIQLKEENEFSLLKYIQKCETKVIKIKKGSRKGNFISGVQQLTSFKKKYEKDPSTWYCLERRALKRYKNIKDFIKNINKNKNSSGNPKNKIIIQKIFNKIYKIGICNENTKVNNTFYEIHIKNSFVGEEKLIFALLLGSLTMLSIELQGRTNFGGGALDTATFDIGNIMLINPLIVSQTKKKEIIKISKKLYKKPFKNSNIEFQNKFRNILDKNILKLLSFDLTSNQLYKNILKIQNLRVKKANTFKF